VNNAPTISDRWPQTLTGEQTAHNSDEGFRLDPVNVALWVGGLTFSLGTWAAVAMGGARLFQTLFR
jgi:hypothetical protein